MPEPVKSKRTKKGYHLQLSIFEGGAYNLELYVSQGPLCDVWVASVMISAVLKDDVAKAIILGFVTPIEDEELSEEALIFHRKATQSSLIEHDRSIRIDRSKAS